MNPAAATAAAAHDRPPVLATATPIALKLARSQLVIGIARAPLGPLSTDHAP